MLGHAIEDAAGLIQAAAGEQQLGDLLPVARPLLDLVEVAPVGVDRIVSLFVGPVAHYTVADLHYLIDYPLSIRPE